MVEKQLQKGIGSRVQSIEPDKFFNYNVFFPRNPYELVSLRSSLLLLGGREIFCFIIFLHLGDFCRSDLCMNNESKFPVASLLVKYSMAPLEMLWNLAAIALFTRQSKLRFELGDCVSRESAISASLTWSSWNNSQNGWKPDHWWDILQKMLRYCKCLAVTIFTPVPLTHLMEMCVCSAGVPVHTYNAIMQRHVW